MKRPKHRLALITLTLAAAMLACSINLGGPEYPLERIPISTQALTDLDQMISAAVDLGEMSGVITLTITETQLTSYLAQAFGSSENPFLSDPQVYLREGQMQIYGTARSGYLTATARIIMTASFDAQGKLALQLSEADFGPLPVPGELLDVITAMVTEAYAGTVGPVATGFRMETVTIQNGTMVLTGRIR